MKPKILHVIGSLEIGGAERALCKLLAQLMPFRAHYEVVSLVPGGALTSHIERLGIPVRSLNMRRGVPNPMGPIRLARLLRVTRPDVVVTWMYHSNIVGGIAAVAAGKIPVIWNIRDFGLTAHCKVSTQTAAYLARKSARFLCSKVAFVSKASQAAHAASGLDFKNSSVVIPNGFETALYRPSSDARREIRRELALSADARLIGMIARVHRDKDHKNFLAAASRLHSIAPDVHFLLCGSGASVENKELIQSIESAGIGKVIHLLGPRLDIPRVTASLDVAVSSSSSEAFPNAVGEAMSCGVPCVVTDVGDSAYLLADTGRIVPARDSASLSAALLDLISAPQESLRALGSKARTRILNHFTIEQIAPQYEALWFSAIRDQANLRSLTSDNKKAA